MFLETAIYSVYWKLETRTLDENDTMLSCGIIGLMQLGFSLVEIKVNGKRRLDYAKDEGHGFLETCDTEGGLTWRKAILVGKIMHKACQ